MKCGSALIILLVVAGAIILRYVYLQHEYHNDEAKIIQGDIMNRTLFSVGSFNFSLWPISHFVMYMILAFFFPDCWLFLFAIGVTWELVEFAIQAITYHHVLSGLNPKSSSSDAVATTTPAADYHQASVQYDKEWWSGSFGDILFNTAGIVTGLALAKLLRK